MVQHFHGRPLGLAVAAEVFLLLGRQDRRALDFLVDAEDSPFDRVDRLSVVDVVPGSIARSRAGAVWPLLLSCLSVAEHSLIFASGQRQRSSRAPSDSRSRHIHSKEAILSELPANLVQIFGVDLHEVRQIIVAQTTAV